MTLELSDGQQLKVSASIGLAHDTNQSVDGLIDQQNHAMYTVKSGGCDRVCVAGQQQLRDEQAA
jgi:GGDEF domain-containing protein